MSARLPFTSRGAIARVAAAVVTTLAMSAAVLSAAAISATAGAAEEGSPSASRLGALRSSGSDAGFARVLAPRAFEFPRDHGPHPEYRHEWWYLTGNLDGEGGERFGFQLTIFRYALAPPSAASGPSRWRSNQIYFAHFALADVARERFDHAERYARDALGLAGAQASPLRVWIEDWSIEAFHDPARGQETWSVRAGDGARVVDLALTPLSSVVLNGEEGFSRKSDEPGAASYYYSIPRMAARGRVVIEGRAHSVRGLAWLDREWGSGSLGARQDGWDWFALQLADGSALMFYSLRTSQGRDANSAGTWIAPDGSARRLRNDEVAIDVLDTWESPRGGRYPARWRLRVPSLALDADVHPVLPDQELDTNPRYWEGAVDVQGTRSGAAITGRGYVELVGYARDGKHR